MMMSFSVGLQRQRCFLYDDKFVYDDDGHDYCHSQGDLGKAASLVILLIIVVQDKL